MWLHISVFYLTSHKCNFQTIVTISHNYKVMLFLAIITLSTYVTMCLYISQWLFPEITTLYLTTRLSCGVNSYLKNATLYLTNVTLPQLHFISHSVTSYLIIVTLCPIFLTLYFTNETISHNCYFISCNCDFISHDCFFISHNVSLFLISLFFFSEASKGFNRLYLN